MSRSELRRFTAASSDQLLWWELVTPIGSECDLDLSDLERLDDLIHTAAMDGASDDKLKRLARLLTDAIPTLVFTGFRETVRYLRDHLGGSNLAWCTGQRAGIGRMQLDRTAVLTWFRGNRTSILAPQHLIVTDVAAEGLDLQRAGRVVHYDLPWTGMRVQQREGRSLRYGSAYPQVQVVRFSMPAALERLLGVENILAAKCRLPAAVGIGDGGGRVWRWRSELADRFHDDNAINGTALVVSQREGLLAGFELHGGRAHWHSSTVLWLERDGSWSEAPAVLRERLDCASAQAGVTAVAMPRLRRWLTLLSSALKDRINRAVSSRWSAAEPTAAVREVAARLQGMIGMAARRHQPIRLAELENAMHFVIRGHTAGEAAAIQRMARLPDTEFDKCLSTLPAGGIDWAPIEARLTGLILFGPESAPPHARAVLSGPGGG